MSGLALHDEPDGTHDALHRLDGQTNNISALSPGKQCYIVLAANRYNRLSGFHAPSGEWLTLDQYSQNDLQLARLASSVPSCSR